MSKDEKHIRDYAIHLLLTQDWLSGFVRARVHEFNDSAKIYLSYSKIEEIVDAAIKLKNARNRYIAACENLELDTWEQR